MNTAHLDGKRIRLCFPFSWTTVEFVRTLPGARFHKENSQKFWTVQRVDQTLIRLRKFGFSIEGELAAERTAAKKRIEAVPEITIRGLKGELFPFQKQGASIIEALNGRVLLADEPGLGKTMQTLAWLHHHPELRPAIVVCPAAMKLQWVQEGETWAPNDRFCILSSTASRELSPEDGTIFIINYDVLQAWTPTLKLLRPPAIVLDECHFIMNRSAHRTRAARELVKGAPHIIAISATPADKRPIQLYSAIKLVSPKMVGSRFDFGMRYCAGRHNGFGWVFNGASHTEELHELLSTIMIRRKREEVLPDLPQKLRSYVPMELDNWDEYKQAETDFISWVKEVKGSEAALRARTHAALMKTEPLRQLAVKGKLLQATQWIQNFIENQKLVVFCTHTFPLDHLMREFKDAAVRLDGKTSQAEREQAKDKFWNDPDTALLVGNIRVAGVGMNLQVASAAAFLELGPRWSPGEHDQAEDRILRIGQKAQSVNIYYLLAAGTIEERIAKLIDAERRNMRKILDGESEVDQNSLISQLMKNYMEESKQ